MTVAELIAALQNVPPGKEIVIEHPDSGRGVEIVGVEETPIQVFLLAPVNC